MDGFLTAGHPSAVAAVRGMLAAHVPHALLVAGPPSVGKHALALDLAAALLCTGETGDRRPCRICRTCRMVEHGNHPDLHRLDPGGPGGQIRIGDREHPEAGTVRWLATQLALLPVEAGARVAIVRDAQRMNEDAQSALLKTLEEPPDGVTLILCADDEERLMPTIRSRCARLRLGAVGTRDIEQLLVARGIADPPRAARLARLAGGRPGLAVRYASSPEAEAVRAELARTLLDLLRASPGSRLEAAGGLMRRAATLAQLLDSAGAVPPEPAPAPKRRGSTGRAPAAGEGAAAAAAAEAAPRGEPLEAGEPGGGADPDDAAGAAGAAEGGARVPAAERRRALAILLDTWRSVARDLSLAQLDAISDVRDVSLLEEIEQAAAELLPGDAADALAGLVDAGELLEANVSPELVLDARLLAWPARVNAASVAGAGR